MVISIRGEAETRRFPRPFNAIKIILTLLDILLSFLQIRNSSRPIYRFHPGQSNSPYTVTPIDIRNFHLDLLQHECPVNSRQRRSTARQIDLRIITRQRRHVTKNIRSQGASAEMHCDARCREQDKAGEDINY
jgi:hypothetical protein